MRRYVDVVRFAPARALLALGDAAAHRRIDARVVDQVLFDQLAILPLARELLARRERYTGTLAQYAVRIGVFGAQRVLHEVGPVVLYRSAQRRRVGRVE